MSAVCCGGVESRTFQEAWLRSPEHWELLLDGGVCPQPHTVGTQETPLHLAARFSRPTAARRLLEAGANPNAPDQAGRTPLHTAVAADAREVCQVARRGVGGPLKGTWELELGRSLPGGLTRRKLMRLGT